MRNGHIGGQQRTHTAIREISQIDFHFVSSQSDLAGTQSRADFDGVKELRILHHIPTLTQTLRQQQGRIVDLLSDVLQSLRSWQCKK